MIYHTLLFDHIGNDKCPNDSRRIMPFVAHLVRRRKVYALKNSSDSLSCAALDIFFSIIYLRKLMTCAN